MKLFPDFGVAIDEKYSGIRNCGLVPDGKTSKVAAWPFFRRSKLSQQLHSLNEIRGSCKHECECETFMANAHIEIVYQRCTLILLSVAYKEKEENHISSNEG
jgi:hypothetical protein